MIKLGKKKANKKNLESCSSLDIFLPTPSIDFKPLNVCRELRSNSILGESFLLLVPPLPQNEHVLFETMTSLMYLCCVYWMKCCRLQVMLSVNKYMLFAGWEVRTVKHCDRGLENAARGRSGGLENAARGRRPRVAFSRPRSQFFTTRTDLSR